MATDVSPGDRAQILIEALPYIRKFSDKIVVVKYGGNAIAGTSEHDALALFAEDIVLLKAVGLADKADVDKALEDMGSTPETSAKMYADLEQMGEELGFTVKLQHENIFVATNQLRLTQSPQG